MYVVDDIFTVLILCGIVENSIIKKTAGCFGNIPEQLNPERIFTVTGVPPSSARPPAAFTTASATLKSLSGSRVSAEPAPVFMIFGTGQPQFMSMHSQ